MTLESYLPSYDVNEVHDIEVRASPEAALTAARALTPREVPVATALLTLRRLPALLRGRAQLRRQLDRPLLDQMVAMGFSVLAEEPEEVVLGVVGRFWHLDSGIQPLPAEEFRDFAEPGYAKGAMNFRVAAVDSDRTRLTTETRVKTTSDAARRSFARYWRFVGPGSAAIRRILLRAIRRRAERPPTGERNVRPL